MWLIFIVNEAIENIFLRRKILKHYRKHFNKKINLVIDVGAHSGQSIEFFLNLNSNCKIYSFEPNPRLYEKLAIKYSRNPNIHLFQLGISDKIGQKIFHENILDTTSTFEKLNVSSKWLLKKLKILGTKPHNIVTDSYPVEVTTLSYVIDQIIKCDETIDILKIDTEGHEYSCLVGLFDNHYHYDIEYIQIENHLDDMYLNRNPYEDIVEVLDNNGFETCLTVKHVFVNFDEVIFKKRNR